MAIAIIRLLEIVNVEDKKGIPSARCPGKYCFDQAFRFPFTVEPGHLIQHGLDLNFLLLLNILSIGKHVNRVIFRRIENVGIYSHPEILICVLRHLEIIAQMMVPAFIFPDNIGRIKGRDIALPELFFYLLIGNDTQTLAVRQIVGAKTFKILPRSFPDTAIFSDIELIDIIIELFGGSDKAFLPFLHQLCNLLKFLITAVMMRRTDTTIIISRIPVRIIWIRIPCSSWPVFCSTTRCQFSSGIYRATM